MVSIFIVLSLGSPWVLVCSSHEIMFWLQLTIFALYITFIILQQKNSLNRSSTQPSLRLREHVEEEAEKSSELEDGEICHKKMSSAYDIAVAPMEQDLQQVWPCQHFNQEERIYRAAPLTEGLLTVNGFWEEGCRFLQWCAHWKQVSHAL